MSFEAFEFGRERDLDPHLRLSGHWNLTKNIYFKAGYDDPLVDEFESPFFGAGLRWTDDDLKYLLGSVPSF
jgi:phospholipid/cholesterol/gamma-HCH transport system substrate-binding protein